MPAPSQNNLLGVQSICSFWESLFYFLLHVVMHLVFLFNRYLTSSIRLFNALFSILVQIHLFVLSVFSVLFDLVGCIAVNGQILNFPVL